METTNPQTNRAAPERDGTFVEGEELAQFLLEATGDSVLFLNPSGDILYSNDQARQSLEMPGPDYSGPWVELIWEPSRGEVRAAFEQAKSGKPAELQVYSPVRGQPRWWRITIKPLIGPHGLIFRYFVHMRDTSDHMLTLKALRQSEEGFRRIFEENPIGMVLVELDLRVVNVNNALCGMLGYTCAELEKFNLRELNTDSAVLNQGLERLLRGETSSFQLETQYLTKQGRVVWGHVTTSLFRDPDKLPLYFVQMIENISERKKSEQELVGYQEQLQSLASELSLGEERERRRIATGLHDRIGQTLALARLKLGTISHPSIGAPAEVITQTRELIEQAIMDTRSLTFELSPPVLYELGLIPALEWLARNIQQEHGVITRFHDDGLPKPLDEKFRVVLFQAVRELLFNIVKHARASHAQVMTRRDADALRIVIEDDGIGFNPNNMHSGDRMKGFGLFNIRERVEYLGGRMKIRSEPGLGTRITLMAPLHFETGKPN